MEERLAARGGQDGESSEHSDSHPGDLEKLLDEPERGVDRQRYLGGDTACDVWEGNAELLTDRLGGVAEQ